jgi:hypothetical protein
MLTTIPLWAALSAVSMPAILTLMNLRLFRRLPKAGPTLPAPALSVLIPARDEESNIASALESILAAAEGVELEVVVLDDQSSDATAEIVASFSERDPRVRLGFSAPLPQRWCGKQHACYRLAGLATHDLLVFIDADVRLEPGALLRIATAMNDPEAPDLLSGFPRQVTGTFLEMLLLPLIHFILLGFLPMDLMRRTNRPGCSAGCGQLMIAKRLAYEGCGGHAAIRSSLHDGVKLPREFRKAGYRTDLFDATDIATCRMYYTNAETWAGLGKNATEGLGAPATIVPMTLLLLTGQVLLFVILLFSPPEPVFTRGLLLAICILALLPRVVSAFKFRQSLLSAVLHPLGILVLLAIQWQALGRLLRGRPAQWKARKYGGDSARG